MKKYNIETASKLIFETLRREHTLDELVNLGAKFLGTYTSYSNSAYKHRAISKGYLKEDILQRNNYFETQDPMVAYNELIVSLESKQDNTPFIMEATGTSRRWISKSYYCGKHVGHFTVPEVDIPLEDIDTEIIKLMSDACAISFMMKNSVTTLNSFMPTQASLLESVLNGSIKDLKTYNDSARLYAQKSFRTYFLVCGTFSQQTDSHITQLISNQIEYHKYNAQVILFNGKLVILIGTDEKKDLSKKLIESLDYICNYYGIYMAVSDAFHNIMESRAQFKYTSETLKILLNDYDDRHILFHDDCKLGLFLSYAKEHIENLMDFLPSILKKMIHYDSENNTSYAKTLRHFVANNCSYKATADEMFVHKNTIVYRVKKMEELFGLDIDNASQIFNLRFAFILIHKFKLKF